MASKVDSSSIKRTVDTLGKVISKPPLTEKLLSRPPFKYLHDIIMQVDKASGVFRGLYSSLEKDSKTIGEKEAKIQFLQKAINTISFTIGEVVPAKPSKIVAGHEADKTNEFLQLMASAVLQKLDSSNAVKRVLKGEDPALKLATKTKDKDEKEKKRRVEKVKASEGESSPKTSRSKERPSGEKTRPPREASGGDGRKHSGSDASTKKAKPVPQEESTGKESNSSLQSKSHHKLSEDSETTTSRPVHKPSRKRPSVSSTISTAEVEEVLPMASTGGGGGGSGSEGGDDEGLGSETRLDRPSSARGSRKRGSRPPQDPHPPSQDLGEPIQPLTEPAPAVVSEARTTMGGNRSPSPPAAPVQGLASVRRPGSARPAPPRIVTAKKSEDMNVQPSHMGEMPPSVILDTPGGGGDNMEDDDDQFVVEDSVPLAPPPEEPFSKASDGIMDEKPEGALTKNIVAMKEHLEGTLKEASEENAFLPAISEAQRKKEREIVAKEIERLQASIQTLCKSANPLGKIMDYVQEDIDSMQKELEMWQVENRKHSEAVEKEQGITELELQPLRSQLEELEAKIVEQVDMISATKANILKNDVKTQQMLNSMTFGSS